MLKKILFPAIISLLLIFFITSCSDVTDVGQSVDEDAINAELNKELSRVMECYQNALLTGDPDSVNDLAQVLEDFDQKYGSDLADEFGTFMAQKQARLTEPINDFPPLTDLPVKKDGDVYLSGGANSLAGYLVDWVAPNVTAGNYNHGAVLDLDKFDPTDLETPCYQTAVQKGAGYETVQEWMTKQNVVVMSPVSALNSTKLNAAQTAMDYYCDPNNTNMQYGFFKNYVNFFSLVEKQDNYYWYCTKVIWRVYNDMGIDVDSNTGLIDWTTSGLYSIVKTYYQVIYFWSKKKANQALQDYINKARKTIVLSEEIYFSPYLKKYYEVIR
ncbi:MAG: hypothetical protein JXB88_10465 [Spirochaetales bacterium]|nr:hypothetical protein [Spirochaetales bacterium]